MTHQERKPRIRTYLMCPPEHFVVEYAINPWMDITAPVDAELALKQWDGLREALVGLGHTVHVMPPLPALPDMVYAANGAVSVDGVVYGARFRYPQRTGEAAAHRDWYESNPGWRFVAPTQTNEGEGDFAYLPGVSGGLLLAGYGFRTEPAAHPEAAEVLGRPVVSLRLVDPRFYHLDTALAALDDTSIAYYPGAFSESSQRILRQLFPAESDGRLRLTRSARLTGYGSAVVAEAADAETFGLNLVSDGRTVVLNSESSGMAAKLAAAGFVPVPVELGELRKGGGSVKCCIAELRPTPWAPAA